MPRSQRFAKATQSSDSEQLLSRLLRGRLRRLGGWPCSWESCVCLPTYVPAFGWALLFKNKNYRKALVMLGIKYSYSKRLQ